MQTSINNRKLFNFQTVIKYIFLSIFFVFTVILFSASWKVQQSCNPIVGKSSCIPKHRSIIDKSWNGTKEKALQLKNTTNHAIFQQVKRLPKSIFTH